jgi:hypothetical protein
MHNLARGLVGRLAVAMGIFMFSAAPLLAKPINGSAPQINYAPVLESFTVIELDAGVYALEGYVQDERPEWCFVVFGGVLEGHYVFVEPNGYFLYTVELGFWDTGAVSAQAVDELEQLSNVLWDEIQ